MSKLLWNTLKVGPTVVGASLLISSSALGAQKVPDRLASAVSDKATVSPKIHDSLGTTEAKAETKFSSSSISFPEIVTNNTIAPHPLLAQAISGAESTTSPSNNLNLQQTQIENNQSDDDPMGQVTNVSQFRDVQPSDWAYEALSRVVERYGCLQGYPDGTYRGNRALSRYEFAAGLNHCLQQVEKLIAANGQDYVRRSDFEALQRLSEEFRAELSSLGTRVDNLEGRTAFLEQHQFSTTTKLNGEVVIGLSDVFGDRVAVPDSRTPTTKLRDDAILSNRVRLNFDTSFTGKDRLRTRLQARNTTPFNSAVTGTNMTRLGFDTNDNNDTDYLGRLEYRFPFTSKGQIFVEATGGEFNDIMYNFNPLFEASGTGSISRFGRFNPIYRQSGEGTGASLSYNLSKQLGVSLGYLVPRSPITNSVASNPNPGYGLFNGGYAALAQVEFRPSSAFNFGLTYVHAFNNIQSGINVSGGTGSGFANTPFGNVATSSNQFGVEANLRLSPRIVLSGWGGYTQAIDEVGPYRADIWNYGVTLGFPDFGRKGNLLGFVFGMPPKVTSNDLKTREDSNTSYHVEGFYRYQVTKNVSVTPGLFVILNPEHNDNNDTEYVGTLRTTFNF